MCCNYDDKMDTHNTQTLHVCHICLHWGGLRGQCRHTWSIWDMFVEFLCACATAFFIASEPPLFIICVCVCVSRVCVCVCACCLLKGDGQRTTNTHCQIRTVQSRSDMHRPWFPRGRASANRHCEQWPSEQPLQKKKQQNLQHAKDGSYPHHLNE